MGLYSDNLRQRFDETVELVPFSDCHYWMGRLNDSGYGVLSDGKRDVRAHRLAYELAKGEIPTLETGRPAHILHSCDNPLCVNPDHLRPGSHADNMADKVNRGRQYRGERHHYRKLTDAAVKEVCRSIVAGETNSAIAQRHDIGEARVAMIRHGHAFRDVLESVGGKPATGRFDRKLSDERAVEIYLRAHGGDGNKALAKLYGVSPTCIADIKRGATYASVTGHGRLS